MLDGRDLEQIRHARERLIHDGLMNSHMPSALVPLEIEQSWRRSVSQGVNPQATPQTMSDFALDTTLISAANRVLDQWTQSLESSNLTLVLADKQGRIVARRTNDARDAHNLDRVNAVEGSDFSEKSLGTNGLGTSLEGRDIVLVRGPEHYNEALSQLVCSGTPIVHPISGRIVGSLSIAASLEAPDNLIKAITRQVGLQISQEIENFAQASDLDLARTFRKLKSSRRPILVMNSESVMSDFPALPYLDTDFHALLWDELKDHQWTDRAIQLTLPALNTEAVVRRLGTARNAIFAVEFFETLQEQTTPSAVIPAPQNYPRIGAQLTTAAISPGLIRLHGPRGVGKKFQAINWLKQRTNFQPMVVTISDPQGADLSWTSINDALSQGRGVVFSTAMKLDDALLQQLAGLARGLNDAARIVLSERRHPDNPESAREFGPIVTMPPITADKTLIPVLARELAAQIYPDAPAPKFSPDTRTQLLAWPWLGNVDELAQLLQDLPQIPLGQVVQLHHLPSVFQQYSVSGAGSIENAERTAIINALRAAHGNKSEAADILNIGRTTLYRKIRSLKINLVEIELEG